MLWYNMIYSLEKYKYLVMVTLGNNVFVHITRGKIFTFSPKKKTAITINYKVT